MRLLLCLAVLLAASVAAAQFIGDDVIVPDQTMKLMTRAQQCRYCFKHLSKFCVSTTSPRPLLSDHDGQCVRSYEACPVGTVDLKSADDCANDLPATKHSCSLCVLDGYVWCPAPTSGFEPTPTPTVNIGAEFLGKCVAIPAPPAGSTGSAQPAPGDPDHKPQPPSDHHLNPCADALGPYAWPVRNVERCPALIVQKQATDCPKYPSPSPVEPHMPVRHAHTEQSILGMGFTVVFSVLCIAVLCYCCKRRRQLRLLAQQRAAQAAASGVSLPVAEAVNPYTLPIPVQAQYQPYAPSHIAVPAAPEPQIQYPQVIQTAPVRNVGGPVIASNISFVPRDDIELGSVGANGYARVAQNE